MSKQKLRPIAFYLPQYHPVPENDAWWGQGFTEWRNVIRAQPLFPSHYQPHLPADLGFYDLRVPEVRESQAALARQYGIHGFCYYHYWFNGRRILERPFEEVLRSGKPDFPFCLCWANENWTRRWDGEDKEVLLEQKYSHDDDRNHLRSLAQAFGDPRYIRVDNRPVFLVYRASNMPDPARTTAIWREEARALGFEGLYLCCVESIGTDHGIALRSGFDAAVEFAPDWEQLPPRRQSGFGWRVARKLRLTNSSYKQHHICDYAQLIEGMLKKPGREYLRYPCVTPSWDNTARRREGAIVLHEARPDLYEGWLNHVLATFQPPSPDENFIFINAWNEWAEGNHLEPCAKWGHAFLDATRRALQTHGHRPSRTNA